VVTERSAACLPKVSSYYWLLTGWVSLRFGGILVGSERLSGHEIFANV